MLLYTLNEMVIFQNNSSIVVVMMVAMGNSVSLTIAKMDTKITVKGSRCFQVT